MTGLTVVVVVSIATHEARILKGFFSGECGLWQACWMTLQQLAGAYSASTVYV